MLKSFLNFTSKKNNARANVPDRIFVMREFRCNVCYNVLKESAEGNVPVGESIQITFILTTVTIFTTIKRHITAFLVNMIVVTFTLALLWYRI